MRVAPHATTNLRPGELAEIVGVLTDRKIGQRPEFAPGTIYTIEYSDGSSVELHEDDLTPVGGD